MRARTLILLLLAVMLAGGTALLARSWLATQRNAERVVTTAPPPAPSKSILVARADIRRGQILRPEDLIWQVWPEGALDKNYVVQGGPRKPETFAGWVARNPIGGGEPVTESRIIAPGSRGFLAAVLQPGMRAISVPVTITSGISGFIFPGDYVDVLLTYSVPAPPAPASASGESAPKSNYDHKAAETVLRNIRVIAIDQRLESKAGEAVPAHTATFEVTPKQSEVIALASEIGKVSLSLRSLVPAPNKDGKPEDTVATASDQTSGNSSVAATATYTLDSEISPLLPKVSDNKDTSTPNVVTILRGSAKTREAADLSKLFGTISEITKPGGT